MKLTCSISTAGPEGAAEPGNYAVNYSGMDAPGFSLAWHVRNKTNTFTL